MQLETHWRPSNCTKPYVCTCMHDLVRLLINWKQLKLPQSLKRLRRRLLLLVENESFCHSHFSIRELLVRGSWKGWKGLNLIRLNDKKAKLFDVIAWIQANSFIFSTGIYAAFADCGTPRKKNIRHTKKAECVVSVDKVDIELTTHPLSQTRYFHVHIG